MVPTSALVRDDAGTAVYLVNGDTATRTAITTGIESDGIVEVLTGVSAGQQVLTSGVHGLGAAVKIAKPE